MSSFSPVGATIAAAFGALVAFAVPAAAVDFQPELAARGWFFKADGDIEDTALEPLGFDELEGQLEVRGGLGIGEHHHVELSYTRLRRSEEGRVSAVILGLIRVEDEATLDLDVDYYRLHYGYRFAPASFVRIEPFVDVGFLDEHTLVVDRTTGESGGSDDFAVFPMLGAELVLGPGALVHPRLRVAGMGTGGGHLVDVEGGLEGVVGPVFGGLGYRNVDYRIEDQGRDVANVNLDGFYVEGGVRF
ncbi:MAG: hypothetical protein QOD06_2189 [Candidatus Binatota bacterium]|nr:hypothetical protein [Candidatus Binatota bacterium]